MIVPLALPNGGRFETLDREQTSATCFGVIAILHLFGFPLLIGAQIGPAALPHDFSLGKNGCVCSRANKRLVKMKRSAAFR
jgi:hypothetical protein